jgi:hypothetical protein
MKARLQSKQDPQDSLLFLRIKHPTMDPREITHALAIEPTQTITAGMAVSDGVRRMHSESYWIAQLPSATLRDLAENYRAGIENFSLSALKKEELLALSGATEWDVRILLRLREFEAGPRQAFLQKILREGGSIALLVDRGDERSPFVIKRSLAKLAQLGLDLEVD